MLKKEGHKSQKSFLITPIVETIFYKMRYSLSLLFLISAISILSVINDIPQDSIVTLKHRCKKNERKRSKCPINYYANFVASYNLILSNDAELNPEPGSCVKNNAAKCSICNKAVVIIRKRVKCEVCQHLTYVLCLNISKMQQKNIL